MPSNSKEYAIIYYQTHRDEILKNIFSKVRCPVCNNEYAKTNLLRHMKTIKCKKLGELKDLKR